MILHTKITKRELFRFIHNRKIRFAGNIRLKVFGLLSCQSGKRMKLENRVFFENERAALFNGFRPCSHCQREKYLHWKISKKQVEKSPS